MGFKLRPYQTDLMDKARELMTRGCKSLLIQSPTGSGKTALSASMLGSAASKGFSSWFVVHRRELIKQSCATFTSAEIDHGVISAGFKTDLKHNVQICSVNSLSRRLKKLPAPKMIIWDEAHHCAAKTWSNIFERYPKTFHIGLSATPERLDGTGLAKWFDEIIYGPDVKWLIENDFLSSYKYFAPTTIDAKSLSTRMGDFSTDSIEDAIKENKIIGSAVDEYLSKCSGSQAIVFAPSIKTSKMVIQEFESKGIPAVHVDGTTPTLIRDGYIKEFQAGIIKIMSNVNLFGEGFDVPALETIIMLRPTQSLGLYLQMVGRSLRVSPGKKNAFILDHVGNYARHGFPDDPRKWSLDSKKRTAKKGKEEDGISVRVCDSCFAVFRAEIKICPECKQVVKIKEKKDNFCDGELNELDINEERKKKKKMANPASTYEGLVDLGRQRGYKNPEGWARHITNARQNKRRPS